MKQFKYTINGNQYDVAVDKIEDSIATVQVNGVSYTIELEKKEVEVTAPRIQRPVATSTASKPAAGGGVGSLKSPLPGIIIDIFVNVGDVVKKGQPVAMLEAMKMENTLGAPQDGTVSEISIAKGDSVLEGVLILTIA